MTLNKYTIVLAAMLLFSCLLLMGCSVNRFDKPDFTIVQKAITAFAPPCEIIDSNREDKTYYWFVFKTDLDVEKRLGNAYVEIDSASSTEKIRLMCKYTLSQPKAKTKCYTIDSKELGEINIYTTVDGDHVVVDCGVFVGK